MFTRPTGTVTFLFTDVEGSTAHWERHPEWMEPAHRRHEAILRAAITRHGGVAYKMIGDAFQAAFQTAPQALAAAVDAQRNLAAEDWGSHGPLRVRMALHTGTTEERPDDYLGPLLNRVARLMTAGHGGQILLTSTTAELVRDALPARVTLRDLGVRRLRDLLQPEHVFQVVDADLPIDFPPLKTLDPRPHNLPAPPNVFIDREQPLAVVTALLQRPDVRLVTLTGPGGSGKTRLALQVAAGLLDAYTDGVWLVELDAIRDPALVPATIAARLGVAPEPGRAVEQTLQDFLRPRQLLLLLDNLEQVLGAADLLPPLLAAAPRLQILITSREATDLYSEYVYAVPPLAVPDAQETATPEHLTEYAAVQLFIERARARTELPLTAETAPSIAAICIALDGLPLAIELAAARARRVPLPEMRVQLDRRLELLVDGPRDLPPRQRSLRAAMDWSYALLTVREQRLFRRLAVFRGGAALPLIQTVCGPAAQSLDRFQAIVAALTDKSLLSVRKELALSLAQGSPSDAPRVTMLETIHEYAGERLAESGEAAAVQKRHARAFLALAEEAESYLRGPEQRAWLSRLEAEHDNLRAALDWLSAQPTLAAEAVRLAGALGLFWQRRGYLTEGYARLTRILAQTVGAPEAGGAIRAKALAAAGMLAHLEGNLAGAVELLEESLALYRAAGDQSGMTQTLARLGALAAARGDNATSRARYAESLGLARAMQHPHRIAQVLHGLAGLARDEGEYAKARKLWEESLALYRQLDDAPNIAIDLLNLAEVYFIQGDMPTARRLYEETRLLAQALDDTATFAWTVGRLGAVTAAEGDAAGAQLLWQQSLAQSRALHSRNWVSVALAGLGMLTSAQGDHATAHTLLDESLALAREVGITAHLAQICRQSGLVALRAGEPTRAADLLAEGLGLSWAGNDPYATAGCLAGLAAVAAAQGQPEHAAQLFGAVGGLLGALGVALDPAEQGDAARGEALARQQLSPVAWETTWAQGSEMPRAQVVALALARNDG